MSSEANRIVQKLWSYCTVLRDNGLSYGDYLEQFSVLLFLKLAHRQTHHPGIRIHPCRRATNGPRWCAGAA
jgi:type I restriction enzyme M protein